MSEGDSIGNAVKEFGSMDRRRFLGITIGTGASATALHLLGSSAFASGAAEVSPTKRYEIADWIAATPATFYRPYSSKPLTQANAVSWVQVDLGSHQPFEAVKLYPSSGHDIWPYPYGFGTFPLRFKIEASDQPDFAKATLIVDCTNSDYPDPQDQVTEYPAQGAMGRFVRLTVTRMRAVPKSSTFAFSMSNIAVLSSGKNIAERCPATADIGSVNHDDLMQITRPPRPMGEGFVTDHPENVIPVTTWKAVEYQARVPLTGVTLQGGIFQTALENNIGYLLDSFSVDELLRQFRQRAGKPSPPNLPKPGKFWEEDLAGSNAGRFLMGAGNTLRWMDHPELRRRMNAVVDGIDECKQPNGYIMAYPEDTIFYSERGAYTRAWVTHGLIEAGYTGNPKAFGLLRGYYDWFDNCPYLPKLLRGAGLGPQGMIANTRMYFTPVGKPEDMQVIQRYFQENYWLEDLSAHKDDSIWQYPYDRPHCYQVTFFEAYLDLYRATGDPRYLHAMLGGWDLYHDKWEHVGGSMSVEEFVKDPPSSYWLDQNHGELCGSVFWTFFNQRFHLLYPDQEKYVAEIEKSIYNVAIANQAGTQGLRYFAVMMGPKKEPTRINTCCEGQGTRLLGSLPEHIYSLAADGMYVNLFEPSTLSWSHAGQSMQLKMTTQFPFQPDVHLGITAPHPVQARIRVRVPSWASGEMPLMVNAKAAATGQPGSYVTLDRTWSDGDTISFTLPMKLKLTRFPGADEMANHNRYALEYGPILLAAVGSRDVTLQVEGNSHAEDLLAQLTPKPDQPLHFSIAKTPSIEYMPYWKVTDQPFTCFPVLSA
jgi:uncharacterized protein